MLFALLLTACLPPARDRGERVFEAEIGPDGGELAGGGLVLTIPPGALAAAETLSLTVSDRTREGGWSPTYTFGPEGLTFGARATVTVEVDEPGFGVLYWSELDRPDAFRPVGLAVNGLAEGTTWHFSEAFVGPEGEGCAATPADGPCVCRASDEVADLLCRHDPACGEVCDIDTYEGRDGQACEGYGPRTVIEPWCSCRTHGGEYLCPDAFSFTPSQHCPSEGGLNGFHGVEGEACEGWGLEYDASGTQVTGTVPRSGWIVECQDVASDTTWERRSGTMEGCVPSEPDPGCAGGEEGTATGEGDADPRWSQECKDLLAELDAKGRTTACPEPPSSAVAGTVIGDAIEGVFEADVDACDAMQPRRVSQVVVPNANKKQHCQVMDTDSSDPQRHGRLDVLAVLPPLDGEKLTVRFAEIKPLTRSGLDMGWSDVYDCYEDRVREAGAKCPAPTTPEEQAFCEALGAVGRTVEVARDAGLSWEPEEHVKVALDGVEREVMVVSCAPGVTAYQCVD